MAAPFVGVAFIDILGLEVVDSVHVKMKRFVAQAAVFIDDRYALLIIVGSIIRQIEAVFSIDARLDEADGVVDFDVLLAA